MNRQLDVTNVKPNSPADKAGLRTGDTLVKTNGKSLKSHSDVRSAIQSATEKGTPLPLTVMRNGDVLTLSLQCPEDGVGMDFQEYEVVKKPAHGETETKKKGLSALTTPVVIAVLGYTALHYFYDQRMIDSAESLLHDNSFPHAEVLRASFPLWAPLMNKADIDIVVEHQDDIDVVVMTYYGNPFYSSNIYMEISGEQAMKLRY